jgi:hypothetical protein
VTFIKFNKNRKYRFQRSILTFKDVYFIIMIYKWSNKRKLSFYFWLFDDKVLSSFVSILKLSVICFVALIFAIFLVFSIFTYRKIYIYLKLECDFFDIHFIEWYNFNKVPYCTVWWNYTIKTCGTIFCFIFHICQHKFIHFKEW